METANLHETLVPTYQITWHNKQEDINLNIELILLVNNGQKLFLNNTGYTQKNGAISKVNKKFISHLTRAQRTPPAAATVQVSHALPAVRFSSLLRGRQAAGPRGRGACFQDGVAAGKGFLCAPF